MKIKLFLLNLWYNNFLWQISVKKETKAVDQRREPENVFL